jgi:pimeloyl-ACP methyl ester carboxylesterase
VGRGPAQQLHLGQTLGLALGLTLVVALLAAPAGRAAGTPCGKTQGLLCTDVPVPLDRSGQTPGTVTLHVEVLPADGTPRGVMFLIAGGPGQGSAHVFDLGTPQNAALYRFLFPNTTLVAYDDRGTGASGLLQCPALQNSTSFEHEADFAAACAASLGPASQFYGTRDHAEDLEAVRTALGFDRVGLWGTSYGTKLALAYALAHPDHVERLLLDSVVPPDLPDPFSANVLQAMPATLEAFCSDGSCAQATPDFAADVVAVANRLAAKPFKGSVLQANGTRRAERIDGLDVLSVVIDADLNPGLAAELPAVFHAARLGDNRPLLRMHDLDALSSQLSAEDLSAGLFAATVCRDGPFPWQPATPVADRAAQLQAAIAALPPGALGPFGTWAIALGNAELCVDWPSPSGGAGLGPGPLPDVPALILSGGFDMRTPTAGGVSIAAKFPQGHVLVVPGVGHSVASADFSFCAARAVRVWMLGQAVPATCARPKPIVATIPALPAAGATTPKKAVGPLKTFAIVDKTLREAEAAWLMTSSGPQAAPIAGLYGGRLVGGAKAFTLVRYSVAPGVAISGKVDVTNDSAPLKFRGLITVSGVAASTGIVGLFGDSLRGTLGGKPVGR